MGGWFIWSRGEINDEVRMTNDERMTKPKVRSGMFGAAAAMKGDFYHQDTKTPRGKKPRRSVKF